MINQVCKAQGRKYLVLPSVGICSRELGGSRLQIFAHAFSVSALPEMVNTMIDLTIPRMRSTQGQSKRNETRYNQSGSFWLSVFCKGSHKNLISLFFKVYSFYKKQYSLIRKNEFLISRF